LTPRAGRTAQHFQPKEDAALVRVLVDACAIVMGKVVNGPMAWFGVANG
jgi:hypothetical protein